VPRIELAAGSKEEWHAEFARALGTVMLAPDPAAIPSDGDRVGNAPRDQETATVEAGDRNPVALTADLS
jgi:hypothetical protein